MNALTTVDNPSTDVARFELMQREAKMFSMSPLVPDHLRKGPPEQALANCYIALKMAQAMGENAMVVLQNIHIVNGKAGFASQYMIARANASGIFKGRIDWRIDRSDKNNLQVTAYATLKDTGKEVSVTVDMAMAQAEGWTKNPKYKSMPEVMLRYRSAAFLVRFYAPDVMLGYQTAEEVEDVAAGARALPLSDGAQKLSAQAILQQAEEGVIEGEVEDVAGEAVDEDGVVTEVGGPDEAEPSSDKDLFGNEIVDPVVPEISELPADASEAAIKDWMKELHDALTAATSVDEVNTLRMLANDGLMVVRGHNSAWFDRACKGFGERLSVLQADAA